MGRCKWPGGPCDQQTNDPSGFCTEHRKEDQIKYEKSRAAAVQKFADVIREEVKKQKAAGAIDAEIQEYIVELEHLMESM